LSNLVNTTPRIVAAIPAYNEEYFIGTVVTNSKKYVSQVVVIDDGSTDGTSPTAIANGALVLRHETNGGYGKAIRHCFDMAREDNVDILVTLDGDGQHNPAEIPRLVGPILRREADLVIGSRFLKSPQVTFKNQQTDMPRYRKFGINIITGLFNVGSKTRVSDAQSGFRAYNRTVLDSISLTETGMAVSVEILVKARDKGFTIYEVPISCNYQLNRHSLNPIYHGLTVALAVISLRFQTLLYKLNAKNRYQKSRYERESGRFS
jgi:glycosyltransferase involved in cell wall biosynthesis